MNRSFAWLVKVTQTGSTGIQKDLCMQRETFTVCLPMEKAIIQVHTRTAHQPHPTSLGHGTHKVLCARKGKRIRVEEQKDGGHNQKHTPINSNNLYEVFVF